MAERHTWTDEHIKFIRENVTGISVNELQSRFNKHFNLNRSLASIRAAKTRLGLSNGRDTHFKKGVSYDREKLPIGSETCSHGYWFVKRANNLWVLKHRYLWEMENGPVPEGSVIIFGDGNPLNFDLSNLLCVTRQDLLTMNEQRLIFNSPELTKTGLLIAQLINATRKRGKKAK